MRCGNLLGCAVTFAPAGNRLAATAVPALKCRAIVTLACGPAVAGKGEAVRLWDKVLLCCSQNSLNSGWVDKEIQKALQKEERLYKERGKEVLAIIPLNLDGYLLNPQWTDWKQQHVTPQLAANFQGWEQDNALFESQFAKVVKALRTDAASRPQPPPSKL